MSDPRIRSLESFGFCFFFFFDMRRLCFLVAVINVHFHWTCTGITSPPSSLLLLLFVDFWGWPVWLVGFDFPLFWLVFLQQLGILCIYSWGGGLLFFLLVFFTLKGVQEILLWQLASWNSVVFGSYSCNPFLRAAVINRNLRPCELEVLVSLFG